MSAGPKLELRQSQSLVMTQQLQQSIKLLQCNAIELRAFVENELEKNPFLAQEDAGSTDVDDEAGEAEKPDILDSGEPREADFAGDEMFTEDIPSDATWEDGGDDSTAIEMDYLRQGQSITSSGGGSYSSDEDTRGIEDNPSQGVSLREHLLTQLNMDVSDPVKRLIGAHLIDMTDTSGYITDDLEPLAETLGAELKDIEEVLDILQTFDPVGICARDLNECLRLQLKDKDRLDPAMGNMLEHLNLLADQRFEELKKHCGVDIEDLKEMVAEIRELNPKPGLGFEHEIVQAIEPDIFVRRTPDGDWHIELNMGNFPRVMVNKRYYKTVSKGTSDTKDKQYLSEQFGEANWLVRALEQRAQTMLKVGGELIKQQDAFFRLGVRYLKPMTLKDIAAETGYHESTISRVTNGKYLLCPRGTFELKYFFTSALQRSEGKGDNVSSEAVKDYIGGLIAKETVDTVLSDDDIVKKLKERNINVARRTVAKYREAMGIPSSPKRKRMKKSVI